MAIYNKMADPIASVARAGDLACVLSVLPGRTLPMEQLSLPKPIYSSDQPVGAIDNPKGVALGDPATRGAGEPHIYEGSGNFTKTAQQPSSRAVTGISDQGVSLSLVDASIPEAAKAVLGDILGANYAVSDKVQGTVTLQTSKPVSKDGILEIFESVLASNNASVLVDGNTYRVVSPEEAFAAGKPLSQSGTPRSPGVSSEIVPLRNVSAVEMERILRSMAPQNAIARVDSARNLLVLTGTRTELVSMVEIVNTFDVDWMRNMSFGIFPVESSDPVAIAQELDKIFANDRESPSKDVVRFIPNSRMKAVLVISQRPEYLRKAETWIKRIDVASEATEKRAYVYNVQYRPVQELASLLQKVYGARARARSEELRENAPGLSSSAADPLSSGPGGNSDIVLEQFSAPVSPKMQTVPGKPAADGVVDPALLPAEAAVLQPTAVPAELMPAAQGVDDRTSGISIVADDANNALVITATPSEIKRIRQILSQIDVIPAQVLLETTIAEVTLNDDLKFGLRWFFEKGNNSFRLTDTLGPGGGIGSIEPVFAGFSYFLNIPNAKVVLSALSDITNVNVVSSPSLTVLNNKRAVLQIGDEVPVATKSVVTIDHPDAPIANSIDFRHTGVLLNLIPRVSQDGRILLEIDQEVSDAKATTSSTIDSPTIQQRRIKTTVAVNDGGTIVLAGIMQDKSTRTSQQVPLIGSIPIIGNAFKNKDDVVTRTELLIAISPHVIKDKEQIGMIAAEFRDRLNFNTRPQRATPPDHRETLDRIAR